MDFNASLKNYMRFSNKILISLLGDQYGEPTKAEQVKKTFKGNWDIIFHDISLKPAEDGKKYHAQYQDKQADILIPPIDTRVYPMGRFRQELSQKRILKQYEKQFEESLSDYACPDLIKWPGIIIEPDGGLNLCASFEAINCKDAIVSNIFAKPFSKVKKELMQFHQRELGWFIQNIDGIVAGRVSTCKIKNNCYQK